MKQFRFRLPQNRKSSAEMWAEHLKNIKPKTKKELAKDKRTAKMIQDFFAKL